MAGRPETPLNPADGPVPAFAQQLRDLRRDSGGPTYAEMARRARYSAAALSEAARGRSLPTWEATCAYVKACGGDPAAWRDRWSATREAARTAACAEAPPASPAPAGEAEQACGDAAPARRRALPAAGIGVVAALATVLLVAVLHQRGGSAGSGPAAPQPVRAEVLQPADGQRFDGVTRIPVAGTVTGLSPAHTLWCFVVNDDDRWYPYPVSVSQGGRWTAAAGIGPERIQGPLALEVHVVVATPAASAVVEDAVEHAPPDWIGLDELPAGAASADSVEIVRGR